MDREGPAEPNLAIEVLAETPANSLHRSSETMVSPGLALLARFAGHLFAYGLIGTASCRLLSLCGISISSWWLVTGLIASLPLGITFKNLARNYEAAAMGARPMHVLQGKSFGNIDLMLRLLEAMRRGYPGASHRSIIFPSKTQTFVDRGRDDRCNRSGRQLL